MIAALLAGCEQPGTSSDDVRTAAINKARNEFRIPDDADLNVVVWTGFEYDGAPSVCGTISSNSTAMPPQRYLARLEPFEWLVFEDAHDRMIKSQPGKFPNWERYCAGSRG